MRNLTNTQLNEMKLVLETNLAIMKRGLKEFDNTYLYIGEFEDFEDVSRAFTDKIESTISELKDKLVEISIILDERQ